jgi:hypothetical protein
MERDWYTVHEAAQELGLTVSAVHSAIRRAQIRTHAINPRLRVVEVAEVERYRRERLGKRGYPGRRVHDTGQQAGQSDNAAAQ